MSAKFLEGVGGKLAERWVATLLTPAFVFWAGGAIAALQRFGWQNPSNWFQQQPEPLQIALLVTVFCVVAASAFVVQRFDLTMLRFLEGYWHPWLRLVRRWCVAHEAQRSQKIGDRWQTLRRLEPRFQRFADLDRRLLKDFERDEAVALIWQYQNQPQAHKNRLHQLSNQALTRCLLQVIAELRDEQIALDWQQQHFPLPSQLMPTRLGNILRAAEQRPLEKYGLDAIICWPRLWLLLPEAVKKDLQEARADLNSAARVWLWSLLFLIWATLGAWWAIPLGILSALFAYYGWAIAAATTYGDLIEATFDLYRPLLYQSLRWNLPPEPDEERRVGRQLTEYLWRGF